MINIQLQSLQQNKHKGIPIFLLFQSLTNIQIIDAGRDYFIISNRLPHHKLIRKVLFGYAKKTGVAKVKMGMCTQLNTCNLQHKEAKTQVTILGHHSRQDRQSLINLL